MTGGQGVAGSNPAVPTIFRMYVGSILGFFVPSGNAHGPDYFGLTVPVGTVWHVRQRDAALRNAAHLPAGKFARLTKSQEHQLGMRRRRLSRRTRAYEAAELWMRSSRSVCSYTRS